MATRKTIEDILASLYGLWPSHKEAISKTTIDLFFMSLKDISDKQLSSAVAEYLQTGDYFPKPGDLRKLIKETNLKKHNEELKDRFTCMKCGSQVSLIMGQSERGQCLDCSRGLVPEKKMARKPDPVELEGVLIQDRTMCNACKKVLTCYRDTIQEPWKCLDCYTGLTGTQRAQRFTDLVAMMEDKTFKPDWASELDVIPF